MSKTISDIVAMLSTSNNELYDRYIDITLLQDDSTLGSKFLTSKQGFRIVTPATGQKPNITVSAEMAAEKAVHTITVTIYNMDATVDFNNFSYIDIELGYRQSGIAKRFKGQIINIYMAKPNPNGELVITCTDAKLSNIIENHGYTVSFLRDKYTFKDFMDYLSTCIRTRIDYKSVPTDWTTKTFTVNKATYQFASKISVVTWLNSLFISMSTYEGKGSVTSSIRSGLRALSIDAQNGLPPLTVSVNGDSISIQGTYKNNSLTPVLKSLSNIGSAYISGDSHGVVTAPFNPEISIGDYMYINPKYFKTRIAQGLTFTKTSLSSIWCVVVVKFTFSTYTANNMTLELVNVKNGIDYGGNNG